MSGKKPVNTTFENFDLKAEADEARSDTVRFAFEFPELLADFDTFDIVFNGLLTCGFQGGGERACVIRMRLANLILKRVGIDCIKAEAKAGGLFL